ncbi:hypothetical protein Pflav_055400 [Phytohabitans flavus]|uniref:Uncharacterized protein n=2 Tax=Phytohabitans flavus TaxID=1076124 RepID=A0A6F8XZ94_9ACTN|nr:RNA polymerase sigma factor SigJ [Phytohabitans flavus]BCB79130.1 hypothetical protein Pflav_055400 [Phytohabitans flavus]
MRIAVTGGTGTLGRHVVDELRSRGHEVRVLSRKSPDHPVDLTTGEGLEAALTGCAVVVDATNSNKNAAAVLVEGSRRLLAAEAAAGVAHHVCVSIVGCDRVPLSYFRVKAEQEGVVADGPVPWTTVRITQFHELVAATLAPAGRWRLLPVPRARLRTVAVADAARAVADVAEGRRARGASRSRARRSRTHASSRPPGKGSPATARCCSPCRFRAVWVGLCERGTGGGATRCSGGYAVRGVAGGAAMSDEQELALAFEVHRPRLLRVAYATLGSLVEAEDCVQEAWLRLRGVAEPERIRDLGAWLTTTVSRLALDALGSARARRERYVGPWLPEPLVEEALDPADRVTLDESVSMALLVVLERLSPAERTAFLLHDVFGLTFVEVAGVVGRTPAAVRQLAARARRHVAEGRPRFPPTYQEQRRLVDAFLAACARGDLDGLVRLLDPDVVWHGDGGGKVSAVLPVAHGAVAVARALIGFTRTWPGEVEVVTVNGAPGIVARDTGGVLTVVAFTVDGGRIVALDAVRNPEKLASLLTSSPSSAASSQ